MVKMVTEQINEQSNEAMVWKWPIVIWMKWVCENSCFKKNRRLWY